MDRATFWAIVHVKQMVTQATNKTFFNHAGFGD
jgi:hypothetical protein